MDKRPPNQWMLSGRSRNSQAPVVDWKPDWTLEIKAWKGCAVLRPVRVPWPAPWNDPSEGCGFKSRPSQAAILGSLSETLNCSIVSGWIKLPAKRTNIPICSFGRRFSPTGYNWAVEGLAQGLKDSKSGSVTGIRSELAACWSAALATKPALSTNCTCNRKAFALSSGDRRFGPWRCGNRPCSRGILSPMSIRATLANRLWDHTV